MAPPAGSPAAPGLETPAEPGYDLGIAIAVYPPPGPNENKRTATDYILGALLLLATVGLVVATVWLLVAGKLDF